MIQPQLHGEQGPFVGHTGPFGGHAGCHGPVSWCSGLIIYSIRFSPPFLHHLKTPESTLDVNEISPHIIIVEIPNKNPNTDQLDIMSSGNLMKYRGFTVRCVCVV